MKCPATPLAVAALAAAVCALLVAAGCGRADRSARDHGETHGHSHAAPHGGTVVVLGDEEFHLELVPDPARGRLTLYALDGHMENFIRLPAPGIETSLVVGDTHRVLLLTPIAQAATGESIGDTSQFAGEAEWLKGTPELRGTITSLEIRGRQFTNLTFRVAFESKSDSQRKQ